MQLAQSLAGRLILSAIQAPDALGSQEAQFAFKLLTLGSAARRSNPLSRASLAEAF